MGSPEVNHRHLPAAQVERRIALTLWRPRGVPASCPLTAPKRILAIKLADLGDVLNITPALRALRTTFPEARLDVVVNPHTAGLMEGSQLVDEVVLFPKTSFEGLNVFHPHGWGPLGRYLRLLRRRGYDTVINFHHLTTPLGRMKQRFLIAATGAGVRVGLDNGHGGWLTHPVVDEGFGACREVEYWLALARRLGASADDVTLDLPLTDQDRAMAQEKLATAGLVGKRYAVFHPGSGGYAPARRWDPPKFASLAAVVQERFDLSVVLVGTAADDVPAVMAASRKPSVDLSGRLTLKELAAVIARSELFVGADSGVMHIAAAMATPLVAIFGPSNHLAWAPWTPASRSEVVRLGLPCSPCAYVGHRVGQRNGCAARTCLADLDVDRVAGAAARILETAAK